MHHFLNRGLRILLLTNSFVLMAGAMLAPIYALFVEKIGGDLLSASITSAIFALTAGVTSLFIGKYADKKGKDVPLLVGGYAVMAVGFIAMMFANSIWDLFIIQALIGFGEATYSPAFDAVYTRHMSKRKAGLAWGSWEASYYFSSTCGALLGGIIVTAFGFNMIFIIMASMCLVSGTYIYSTKKVF